MKFGTQVDYVLQKKRKTLNLELIEVTGTKIASNLAITYFFFYYFSLVVRSFLRKLYGYQIINLKKKKKS